VYKKDPQINYPSIQFPKSQFKRVGRSKPGFFSCQEQFSGYFVLPAGPIPGGWRTYLFCPGEVKQKMKPLFSSATLRTLFQ
jgi:hypothetical protein